jgi:uncharacterized protein with HEPN domain
MSGKREVNAYVEDMVEACERILLFTRGLGPVEIMDWESPVRDAVLHLLTVLGEAAKHVPPDTLAQFEEIPWADIAGLRDKIVHYYFGLVDETIALTVISSVPAVLPRLRALFDRLDAERTEPVRGS